MPEKYECICSDCDIIGCVSNCYLCSHYGELFKEFHHKEFLKEFRDAMKRFWFECVAINEPFGYNFRKWLRFNFPEIPEDDLSIMSSF